MSDWDYSVDYSADTDPSGYDSWNTGQYNDVNYDLGYSNSWDGGFGIDQIGSDFDYSNFLGGQTYSPDPMSGLSGMFNNEYGGGYSMPMGAPQQMDMSMNMGGMTAPSTNSFIQQLMQNPDKWMKGIGALFEGSQNKKKAQMLNQIANRPVFDPFGSQRPFYQQELRSAVQNPMQAPIVAAQLKGIQDAQSRKDAAAGRRSNVVGSAPAVIAAQGKVMQDYINSMMQPAGAGMAPNSSALANLYSSAANYDTNGYISPISQAASYALDPSQQAIAAALQKLAGGL